jgi:hypothetical protein
MNILLVTVLDMCRGCWTKISREDFEGDRVNEVVASVVLCEILGLFDGDVDDCLMDMICLRRMAWTGRGRCCWRSGGDRRIGEKAGALECFAISKICYPAELL